MATLAPSYHLDGKLGPRWGRPSEPKSGPGNPKGKPKGAKGCPKGSQKGPKQALFLYCLMLFSGFVWGLIFEWFLDGLGWILGLFFGCQFGYR